MLPRRFFFPFLTKPTSTTVPDQLLGNDKFDKNTNAAKRSVKIGKQQRRARVKRAAELVTAGRREKVSESSGRLAETLRIEVKRTASETQTQKQRENRKKKERGSPSVAW